MRLADLRREHCELQGPSFPTDKRQARRERHTENSVLDLASLKPRTFNIKFEYLFYTTGHQTVKHKSMFCRMLRKSCCEAALFLGCYTSIRGYLRTYQDR
jgi:hypothetical protein